MKNFKILAKETYLKMIENSVDSKIFNSIVVQDEDEEVYDLLGDGEFSCATFVSGVLVLQGLIPKVRATVKNLRTELIENEKFIQIDEQEIQVGDIIFWQEFEFPDGSKNAHAGFYVGGDTAVSTSYQNKKVIKHHFKNFGLNNLNREIDLIVRISFGN